MPELYSCFIIKGTGYAVSHLKKIVIKYNQNYNLKDQYTLTCGMVSWFFRCLPYH